MSDKPRHCSFCGRSSSDNLRFISGPNGMCICENCIDICMSMLNELKMTENIDIQEENETLDEPEFEVKTPVEIKEELDKYIVGQNEAKKVLSVAVYNHYKRIQNKDDEEIDSNDQVDIEKSNILVLGPTGSGKTLLARTLAKILNVPFASTDATTLTEAGYVGEDVENILLRLVQNADYDIERAEKGIVYIDEIDKIAKKTNNVSITRDVSGEGVQQALLKIFESTIAAIPPKGGRKHPQQEYINIDTTNILFICGGAFVGLDKIISSRVQKKSTLGFGGSLRPEKDKTDYSVMDQVQPQDLIKFGLIPEFIGRLPIVVNLKPLNEDALMKILVEPKNAIIKQFEKLISLDGVKLTFEKDALKEIARKSIKLETGARGLRAIIEGIMNDVMYTIPSEKNIAEVVVSKECVTDNTMPKLIYSEK